MTNMTSTNPSLPPLYFSQLGAPLSAQNAFSTESVELPAEVMQMILSSYAQWGDLAKLANVQSSWKNILNDAASMSQEAKWDLAQSLLHGTNGLTANPTLAMKHLIDLANVSVDEEGYPVKNDDENNNYFAPAMVEIANCYLEGRGVVQSGPLGLSWLAAAFEMGNDVASAHRLGVIYERDYQQYKGIEVDVYAAATWFEAGADAGHAESMAELALCYELGCGKEQSDEKALDYYMRSADLGNTTAKYSVGEAFEEARGVPQSDEEACLWYYKAALDGCTDSKFALRRLEAIARIVVPGVGRLFAV